MFCVLLIVVSDLFSVSYTAAPRQPFTYSVVRGADGGGGQLYNRHSVLQYFNIDFGTPFAANHDSAIYLPTDGGNAGQVIVDDPGTALHNLDRGDISYVDVATTLTGTITWGRFSFVSPVPHELESATDDSRRKYLPISLDIIYEDASRIPKAYIDELEILIRVNGGRIRRRQSAFGDSGYTVEASDCYNRFVRILPDIRFSLSSFQATDRGRDLIDLVFTPEDYFVQTAEASSNTCTLLLSPDLNRRDGDNVPMFHISGALLKKTNGIHYDYTNRRIGFFNG